MSGCAILGMRVGFAFIHLAETNKFMLVGGYIEVMWLMIGVLVGIRLVFMCWLVAPVRGLGVGEYLPPCPSTYTTHPIVT